MTLHSLIHWVALFLVCGGGGLAVVAVIWVAKSVETVRSRRRQRRSLWVERYRAEQAIRGIRRQAIRDLLVAERAQRVACHDPDVIESTAVEVRR
jgi:hypothetical protein